ncbi:MAG: 30S ribosomal protein S16 [bacterium]|nr:30S ribosomal protein S16 [bacterium]
MLSIRLTRVGKKKLPMYRLTVMEKGRDPWGHALEILGSINPHTTPRTTQLKTDRIQYWIEKGASPTDTVWNLLIDEKVITGEKRTTVHLTKKRRGKMGAKVEEAKAKEEEAKVKAEEAKATEIAEKELAKETTKAEEAAALSAKAEEAEAPKESPEAESPKEEVKTEEAPAEEAPAETEKSAE